MTKANFWKLMTGAGSTTSLKGSVKVGDTVVPVKVKLAEGIRPKGTAGEMVEASASVGGTVKADGGELAGVGQSNSRKLTAGSEDARLMLGLLYGTVVSE